MGRGAERRDNTFSQLGFNSGDGVYSIGFKDSLEISSKISNEVNKTNSRNLTES